MDLAKFPLVHNGINFLGRVLLFMSPLCKGRETYCFPLASVCPSQNCVRSITCLPSDFIWDFRKLPFPSHLGKYFIKIGKIRAKIHEFGKIKAIFGLGMTLI